MASSLIPPNGWSLGPQNSPMFFDAWLRLQHNSSLTITQHPVETGAAITDHSFSNPLRFSFELGVTSCAQPIVPSDLGGANRPIRAYNKLLAYQQSRALLTLVTKYNRYDNILIESMDAFDDFNTQNTLKVTVNCVRIIIVSTQLVAVSITPQVTDTTNKGTVTAQPIPNSFQGAIQDAVNTYNHTYNTNFSIPGL